MKAKCQHQYGPGYVCGSELHTTQEHRRMEQDERADHPRRYADPAAEYARITTKR